MTTDPELTRIVRSWLEDGVTSIPDRVLDAVMADLPATPQRRRWLPAWRDLSMNTYARVAAVAAVVAVLVIGGITVARPALVGGPATPTPATSPTSSSSKLLPLAPVAWCKYLSGLDAIVPEGPRFAALEAALGGDSAEWRRLGPEYLALGKQARSALEGLEGLAPVAGTIDREATTLDAWIGALEASFADDAGTDEISRIYITYYDWEGHRIAFINEMRGNFETACP